MRIFTWLCTEEVCVRCLCGEGRAAYCWTDSGAFPFWEPPSTHLFLSSLASMPPDCHLVKGFSRSIPPESCCQTCFIIVNPELLQANGFLCKPERENFSGKTEYISWPIPQLPRLCWCFPKQVFVWRHSKLICHGFPLWNQQKAVTSTGCALTSSAHSACSCHLT